MYYNLQPCLSKVELNLLSTFPTYFIEQFSLEKYYTYYIHTIKVRTIDGKANKTIKYDLNITQFQ